MAEYKKRQFLGGEIMNEPVDFKAIEDSISCIDGIINVKIVGEGSNITEIHVLSNRSKGPKLLVRDIETLIKARFGVEIDHKKISVVSFDLEEPSHETAVTQERPILWGVGWKKTGDNFQADVEIKLVDKVYRSCLTSKAWDQRERCSLVAQAVIDCMNQIVATPLFSLRGVTVHNYCEFDVAVCLVDYRNFGKAEGTLIGTALLRDEIYETVARSALDAVNRKVNYYHSFHQENLEKNVSEH